MCSIDGCTKEKYAKAKSSMCKEHMNEYRRNRYQRKTVVPDPCSCGAQHYAKGMCKRCYLEAYRRAKGIPPRPPAKPKEQRAPRKPRRKSAVKSDRGLGSEGRKRKEVVGYRAAHLRVDAAKGKASEHRCVCGSPAREWSLDPLAVHTYEDGQGRVWSMNIDDYSAYCVPCHRDRDGGYSWHDNLGYN